MFYRNRSICFFYSVLTIVAKRMYRQRVLVKSLQIVETFNAVSVIATDKTGTLTQNKMTVTDLLWDTHGAYSVPIINPEPVKQETILQTIRRLSSGAINRARRSSLTESVMSDIFRWRTFFFLSLLSFGRSSLSLRVVVVVVFSRQSSCCRLSE